MGLSDERISGYLRMEWMGEHALKRLAKAMNVNCV